MPFKDFANGEEALADDVDTYLMRQAVATFANASARTAELPAPVKGQCTARDDLPGGLEMWSGTAWIPVASPPVAPVTYTPTWSAGGSTSGLAIGTGGTSPGVFGWYKMIAPYLMWLRVTIRPGTTGFNGGSGSWAFSLPPGYLSAAAGSIIPNLIQSGFFAGSTNVGSVIAPYGQNLTAVGPWTATHPVAWSNSYVGGMTGVYETTTRW